MELTPIYKRVIGLDVHQAKISACAVAEQADDAVHVLALLVHSPANPLVAISQLDGRRTEPQTSEPAVLGANQVAQLCAHHDPGALGVFVHQLVPQAQVLLSINFEQAQCANLTCLLGHVLRLCHRHAQTPWRSALPGPRRIAIMANGQYKMSGPLEFAQRLGAAGDLCFTAAVDKAEVAAHNIGQCAAMGALMTGEKRSDRFERIGPREGSLDLVLRLHRPG